MKEVFVFLLLIIPQICVNLEFGAGFGAIASSVYIKRTTVEDDDAESEFSSKRQEELGASASRFQEKRQSLSLERQAGTRLNARRVLAHLVERDRLRAERESFLRGFLAQKREQNLEQAQEAKRSSSRQLERRTLPKERAAALHTIRALEARAADKLPEERAVYESDRLAARDERLRAVEELVAHVRSWFDVRAPTPVQDEDEDDDLLEDRSSAVESSSSGSSSSNSSSITDSHVMHGTMVYEASSNMTASWCRYTCDDQNNMCASFLYIEDNGICVFHLDIE